MAAPITAPVLLAALNHKVISEAFEIARSNRTGLLQVVGMSTEYATVYDGYKMGWLDMRVDATSSALTGDITDSATTIPVVDGNKFRTGMVVSAVGSDEVIVVDSVTGNNLTVLRAQGGTVGEAVNSGVELLIDSVGREENSLAQNDGIYQPEDAENFFQTMDTALEFSRRALSTIQYGDTNDLNFQTSERLKQLTIQMDRALMRGRKMRVTVDGNPISYVGGIRYFLDQPGAYKVDNGAAALTLEQINNVNAELVSRGGTTNIIVCGIRLARVLNKLVGANYSSQRLSEWSNDEGAVNMLPSDLPLIGSINRIVIDTNCADDEIFILDSEMITIMPMEQNNAGESGSWRTLDATAPGQDGVKIRVIGDFSFRIRNSKTNMARLFNIG
ncbi:major capsid protein [Vibrio phage 137E35-1]|nr:major capsid protein [Vibrio phage 137E35-1]CAH9015441.1 major capsid protein [Vibrio phage 230E39-1]